MTTTAISTLSLHDALPILHGELGPFGVALAVTIAFSTVAVVSALLFRRPRRKSSALTTATVENAIVTARATPKGPSSPCKIGRASCRERVEIAVVVITEISKDSCTTYAQA